MDRTLDNVGWMAQAVNVPEILAEEMTPERFMEEFVKLNRPVLIRGAILGWPAIERWRDKQHLKEKCANQMTSLFPHSNFLDPKERDKGMESISFPEAMDRMHATGPGVFTIPSVEIAANSFSELLPDIGDVSFLKGLPPPLVYPSVRYFLYKSAGTAWHIHPCDDTLLCQVVGEKRIGLISGDRKTNKVISSSLSSESYVKEPIRFDEAIHGELKPYVAHLKPGDSLFIPPFWWHGVSAVGDTFGASVARCWGAPANIMTDFRFPALRAFWLLSLLPPGKVTLELLKMGFSVLFGKKPK